MKPPVSAPTTVGGENAGSMGPLKNKLRSIHEPNVLSS